MVDTMTVLGISVHLVFFLCRLFISHLAFVLKASFLSYFCWCSHKLGSTSFDDCHDNKSRYFICVIE